MDISAFDADELSHLAANLVGQRKFAEALPYLQRAHQLEPNDANVCLLLGMVYVQSELPERGLEALQLAVKLDPRLYLAHFQIGLLLYSDDREEEASEAWQALDVLGEQHPFVLFKKGLEALSRDEYSACRDYLQRGIEINTPQGPLSAEMSRFLEWVEQEEREDGSPQ